MLIRLFEMVGNGTPLTPAPAPFEIPRAAPVAGGSEPEQSCRFAGEPLYWVSAPPGTQVLAMARSARRLYRNINPGQPGGAPTASVLLEVEPLPGFIAGMLHHLPGGMPVQYVLLDANDAAALADDEVCVGPGEILATPAHPVWLGLCLQDRICRDPRAWAHDIEAAALAGGVERSPGWPGFIAALEGTGPARIRLLDHVGRPNAVGTFAINGGAGSPHTVTLTSASAGDTGIDVSGAGADISVTGMADAILASAEVDLGIVGGALAISDTDRHVLQTRAFDWLAPRSPGVSGLTRFTEGSTVEPIIDGTPYFGRLVADMRAAKGGGAVQLAGWAFVKDSLQDASKPWSLVPEDNSTEIVPLIGELVNGGASTRMLVNQFLQVSDADLASLHTDAEVLLLGIIALMGITQAAHWITSDEAGWVGLLAAYAILPLIPDSALRDLLRTIAEPSKATVEAINSAHAGTAVWTPYPAAFADNPLATDPLVIAGVPIGVVHHMGVYHQKIAMTRPPGGAPVAYIGGIDINSDRVDDPLHRTIAPFHDVQVRLTGPAANDIAKIYAERAAYHATTAPIAAVSDSTTVARSGAQVVQVGRTYFAPTPGSGSAPFPSAPQGERTTHDTLIQAISSARDYIYIEDQYFTPDTAYVDALVAAADPARDVRALVVTVPERTDQPFGSIRRGDIINRLAGAWQDRFQIGAPMRRYLNPEPENFAGLGRMVLRARAAIGDTEMVFGPAERMPRPPFWAFVEGELVFVNDVSLNGAGTGPVGLQDPADPDPAGQTWQRVTVERGPSSSSPRWGARPGKHDKGSVVLAVQIPGIYVHAKLMIVDDVFLSVGSSNLNRRGLEHDGEINSFSIPASLKRDHANPARRLRCRLWAEHLGLPPELGLSLLADPLSALSYFDRSWYRGNRWQPLPFSSTSATPAMAIGTAGNAFGQLVKTVEGIGLAAYKSTIWATLVDPTTHNDAHIDPLRDTGPEL